MMDFWPIGVDLICDLDHIHATTSRNLMGETVEVIETGEIYQHYYLDSFVSWPYHVQKRIDTHSIPRSAKYIVMQSHECIDGPFYSGYKIETPSDQTLEFLKPLVGNHYEVFSISGCHLFRASLSQRF